MYFPVAGWLCWAVAGVIKGELRASSASRSGRVLPRALARYGGRTRYEDVLNPRRRPSMLSRCEGGPRHRDGAEKPQSWAARPRRGGGRAAFWYKHRMENRRSRIFILGGQS